MRWERLFADLEAELASAERLEVDAEVDERTRLEVSRLRLVDRLCGAVDQPLRVHVHGAGPVAGRLAALGADWLLLIQPPVETLVPVGSVLGIDGLGRWATSPDLPRGLSGRLGLGVCLRRLALDRAPVRLALIDTTTLDGTVDRVGADLVELALHAPGEPRRASDVHGVRAVPFAAIATVRRA